MTLLTTATPSGPLSSLADMALTAEVPSWLNSERVLMPSLATHTWKPTVAIPLGTSNPLPDSAVHALGILVGVAIGVFVGTETLVAVDVFVGMLVAV
jgi:hypothetical protein